MGRQGPGRERNGFHALLGYHLGCAMVVVRQGGIRAQLPDVDAHGHEASNVQGDGDGGGDGVVHQDEV